jgi:2-haloacid dehalogenase
LCSTIRYRKRVFEFAAQQRLPAIYDICLRVATPCPGHLPGAAAARIRCAGTPTSTSGNFPDKPGLRDRLLNLYLELDAFPEVADVLLRLKAAGLRTAILSNGSPKMLDAVVKAAGLEPLLDAVLSVESVGVYKPHPKVYQLAVDRLAIPAATIAFQSSNSWDAYAASAFGMQVVWCNRYGQREERLPGKPDRIVRSLAELPSLVGVT